jgi:iron complex transport system substrate-binding protein
MELNDITALIVDSAYQIHRDVGPGLSVVRQVSVPIRIGEKIFDEGFRADLIINGCVIVEIKSVERLAPVHKKQVLTYLKLSGLQVGLLINFGGELLKGNIERLVVHAKDDLKN